MTSRQIISKILNTKSFNIIEENGLTNPELFQDLSAEFKFILEHYEKYNKVPDIATFIVEFKDFRIVECNEPDSFLVHKLREEFEYFESFPIYKTALELLKNGKADEANEYMLSQLTNRETYMELEAVDIFESIGDRVNEFKQKSENKDKHYITTGFSELDTIFGGFERAEELVLIFARLAQGKSYLAIKMLTEMVLTGNRVGFISPEMTPTKVGYRVDTIISQISNSGLIRGDLGKVDINAYTEFANEISNKRGFIVSEPKDFGNKITVSKLRRYIKKYNLDVIAIDGVSYLFDERGSKGDSKTLTLTNIATDLKTLSTELKVPIIIVAQANRNGVKAKDDDTNPDISTVAYSDGIAQNATKTLSIKKDGTDRMVIEISKHRDGEEGERLTYLWDADKGTWTNISAKNSSISNDFIKFNSNKFDDENIF